VRSPRPHHLQRGDRGEAELSARLSSLVNEGVDPVHGRSRVARSRRADAPLEASVAPPPSPKGGGRSTGPALTAASMAAVAWHDRDASGMILMLEHHGSVSPPRHVLARSARSPTPRSVRASIARSSLGLPRTLIHVLAHPDPGTRSSPLSGRCGGHPPPHARSPTSHASSVLSPDRPIDVAIAPAVSPLQGSTLQSPRIARRRASRSLRRGAAGVAAIGLSRIRRVTSSRPSSVPRRSLGTAASNPPSRAQLAPGTLGYALRTDAVLQPVARSPRVCPTCPITRPSWSPHGAASPPVSPRMAPRSA
jgi:hypothetical protein